MTKKYSPSNFLAMFCPRQDDSQDAACCNSFIEIAKVQPNISITTRSYIVYVACAHSTQIAVDEKNQITLILHGEVYNTTGTSNKAEYLMGEYKRQGLLFAKDINGSFAILLIDKRNDSISLITDRLNSRKVFSSKYMGNYWLSSSLYLHPTADVNIDTVGVACYLASGVIYNDRTLFENIRIPERASIHELARDGFHSTRYWSYEFTNAYSNFDEKTLRAELSELLIESVRIRLKDNPKVFLSLSGGYDSIGILGLLHKLNVADVNCFSYALGEPALNSDAYVAKEMATSLGYSHKTIQSYKGNLVSVIKHNAQMGQGLANFCDEVDAWMEMAGEFSAKTTSALFTADTCLTLVNYPTICDFSALSWTKHILPEGIYNTLYNGLDGLMLQILKQSPSMRDHHDNYREFLRVDQELPNRHFPWREFFPGQFTSIREPLLDNSILDFLVKIPGSLRRQKYIYIATITEMFPTLFKAPRASTSGYVANWEQEFSTQYNSIESLILSQDSKLDIIIPPETIHRILIEDWRKEQPKHRAPSLKTLAIKVARELPGGTRVGNKILNYFQGNSRRPSGQQIDHTTFLKRILVMRLFLIENNSKDKGGLQ